MLKNIKTKIRKDAGWLIPGLQVKRWFALIVLGALLITLGVLILIDIRPIFYIMEFIKALATKISTEWLAIAFCLFGAALFFKGWQKTNLSILDIKEGKDDLLENVLDKINENIRFNVNTSLFSTLIVSECYSACWRYS